MFGEFSSHRPTYIVQRRPKEILKFANKSRGKMKSQYHERNTGDLGNASQKKTCLLEHGKKQYFRYNTMTLKKYRHTGEREWFHVQGTG